MSVVEKSLGLQLQCHCSIMYFYDVCANYQSCKSVLLTHILVLDHWKLEKTDVGLAVCGMTIPYFVKTC